MTGRCCDCRCPKGHSGHDHPPGFDLDLRHPAAGQPDEPEPIVAPASGRVLVVMLGLAVIILVLSCLILERTARAAEPCDPAVQSCPGDNGEGAVVGGAVLGPELFDPGWRVVATRTASCGAERARAVKAEYEGDGWRRAYEGAYHNQVEAERLATERGLVLGKALVDLGDCHRRNLTLTQALAAAPPSAKEAPSQVAAVVRTVLIVAGAAAGGAGGAVVCREIECEAGTTAGVTAGGALVGAGVVAIAAWAWSAL